MPQFTSTEMIIDFAINEEQQAAKFYTALAAKADRPDSREMFQDFAREETSHEAKLVRIKHDLVPLPTLESIPGGSQAGYTLEDEPDPDPNMPLQDAMLLAIRKETSAFKLYTNLAEAAQNEQFRQVLLGLAQEEAKHKSRLEAHYDVHFQSDN